MAIALGSGEKAADSNFLPHIEQLKEHITEGGSWSRDCRPKGTLSLLDPDFLLGIKLDASGSSVKLGLLSH